MFALRVSGKFEQRVIRVSQGEGGCALYRTAVENQRARALQIEQLGRIKYRHKITKNKIVVDGQRVVTITSVL